MTAGVPLAPLTGEQGRLLVEMARAAAAAAVARTAEPGSGAVPERLTVPQDVFVTLRVGGRLRGCIGVMEALQPLDRAVRHCAAAAATGDPRFAPLLPEELPDMEIEVSVLGTPRAVRDHAEIVVGQDGLIVASGQHRGLLLPQVAVERGWGAIEFLEQTCLKAGLEPDAWNRGARIEAFRAQVFAERPSGG